MGFAVNQIHSFFAYMFVITCSISIFYAAYHLFAKKEYNSTQWSLAKMTFILAHIQLLVGLFNWMTTGAWSQLSNNTKEIMGNSELRLLYMEHPLINIIAIIIVSIGYFSIKKTSESQSKNKKNLLFYTIGLILILSRIPWHIWMNK